MLTSGVLLAQTSVWRDIYKVKKKDTIYGIAQSYGLTVDELTAANPEMKAAGYTLKKGTMVFIPFPKAITEKKQEVAATGKTKPHGRLKVGVMLPLNAVDADGRRMVEYYRGLLMACDSLRGSGVNADVFAWNVNNSADVRTFLADKNAKGLDIIFGPLYTNQVKPLADFCKTNDIKLVIPFSITATDVRTNDHVYQVYQSADQLNAKAVAAFVSRFKDRKPIFIGCNDSTSQKGPFTAALRQELEAKGIAYQITNLNSPDESFRAAFSKDKDNIVILNTARSQELNLAFTRLNELLEVMPEVNISMFGYTEWLMYEGTYRELYHKYDVYVPSTFYYYKGLSRTAAFEQNYRRWFSEGMQERYIPRMGLAGFDQAYFFLRGLYDKGSAFNGTAGSSSYKPLQTPLRFQQLSGYQGMQNVAFELVHYKKVGLIETIAYQ